MSDQPKPSSGPTQEEVILSLQLQVKKLQERILWCETALKDNGVKPTVRNNLGVNDIEKQWRG
jgi:hypothetical protein